MEEKEIKVDGSVPDDIVMEESQGSTSAVKTSVVDTGTPIPARGRKPYMRNWLSLGLHACVILCAILYYMLTRGNSNVFSGSPNRVFCILIGGLGAAYIIMGVAADILKSDMIKSVMKQSDWFIACTLIFLDVTVFALQLCQFDTLYKPGIARSLCRLLEPAVCLSACVIPCIYAACALIFGHSSKKCILYFLPVVGIVSVTLILSCTVDSSVGPATLVFEVLMLAVYLMAGYMVFRHFPGKTAGRIKLFIASLFPFIFCAASYLVCVVGQTPVMTDGTLVFVYPEDIINSIIEEDIMCYFSEFDYEIGDITYVPLSDYCGNLCAYDTELTLNDESGEQYGMKLRILPAFTVYGREVLMYTETVSGGGTAVGFSGDNGYCTCYPNMSSYAYGSYDNDWFVYSYVLEDNGKVAETVINELRNVGISEEILQNTAVGVENYASSLGAGYGLQYRDDVDVMAGEDASVIITCFDGRSFYYGTDDTFFGLVYADSLWNEGLAYSYRACVDITISSEDEIDKYTDIMNRLTSDGFPMNFYLRYGNETIYLSNHGGGIEYGGIDLQRFPADGCV